MGQGRIPTHRKGIDMNARMNGSSWDTGTDDWGTDDWGTDDWDDLDESTQRRIDMTEYRITEVQGRYYVAYIDDHGEALTLTPDGVDTEAEAEALVAECREMAAQI